MRRFVVLSFHLILILNLFCQSVAASSHPVMLRNRHMCLYCAKPWSEAGKRTRDHIMPRSRGFGLLNNTAIVCKHCNECKADITLGAWVLRHITSRPLAERLHQHMQPIRECLIHQIREEWNATVGQSYREFRL